MKKLHFLTLILAASMLCFSTQTQAQVKNGTEEFTMDTPGTGHLVKLNYQYKTGEDGSHLPHGKFSINFPYQDVTVFSQIQEQFGYTLSGNFKDGFYNGAMKINQNYHGIGYDSWGFKEAEETTNYFLTGSFFEGVPNGYWNVKSRLGTFKGTFNKGWLSGSFHVDEAVDYVELSGAVDANRKPTGVWKWGESYSETFQNGVLVNRHSSDEDMPPAESALAKKYAAGQTTEEELEAVNYILMKKDIKVTEYFLNVVFSDMLANWSEFPGWNFDGDFNEDQKYEYLALEKHAFFKDESMDKLLQLIREEKLRTWQDKESSNKNYVIRLDAEQIEEEYYADINAGSVEFKYSNDVYFTKKQSEQVAALELELEIERVSENIKPSMINSLNLMKKVTDTVCQNLEAVGQLDREHYNNAIAEFVKNNEESQNIYRIDDYFKVEDYIRILQEFGPIKSYELQEITKVPDTEAVYEIAVKLQKQTPGGYAYEDYLVHFMLENHTQAAYIILGLSVTEDKVKKVPNEWDEVTALLDSISTINDTIMASRTDTLSVQLYEDYARYEAANNPKAESDALAAIGNCKRFIDAQHDFINYIPEYRKVMESHAKTIAAVGNTPVVAEAYNNWFSALDLKWKGEEGSIQRIQDIIALQENSIAYCNTYNELIATPDQQLRSQYEGIEDVKAPYEAWYSTQDFKWTPSLESAAKLEGLNALIVNATEYLAKYNELIATPDQQLRSQYEGIEDVKAPYEAWYSTQDFKWTPSLESAAKLEELHKVVKDCLEFTEFYTSKVAPAEKQIRSAMENMLNLNEPYQLWYASLDLKWNSGLGSIKNLEEADKVQTNCLEFIEKYNKIMESDSKIIELTTEYKRAAKLYAKWFKTLDMLWTPAPDRNKQLDGIASFQGIFLSAAEKGIMEELDTTIKKAKVKTMEDLKAAFKAE